MSIPQSTRFQVKPSQKHLSWFLLIRVMFISVFLGGTIIFQIRSGVAFAHPALPYFYLLAGASFLHALASILSLPKVRNLVFFTQTQIAWDLLFCFLLIYITGGIESLFPFLFVFVIISSSVFFPIKDILLIAAASSILYGGLIDFQYYKLLPAIPGLPEVGSVTGSEAFYSIFVHVAAFFLTALLSGALSERWRKSEAALREQRIDYDELEALNRAILHNISSGLMIVNSQGRIRSFNQAATQITGCSLQDVYNQKVDDLFSDMQILSAGEFQNYTRAEAEILDCQGLKRVIGYATSPIHDPHDKELGVLVSFQDLTMVKEMEQQLKRSDRLAAVGRLSAAMAHEIRNPLASISGSVQLLMEGQHVSDEDRRLMGIVVKEAERLSDLLTDFLTYARPRPAQCEDCNLSQVLDELVDICGTDPRFASVSFHRDYAAEMIFFIDRQQVRQALWGLMINAAEAMKGGGQIWLGVKSESGSVIIEDSGPGIPDDIADQVFEPFFTTKQSGSGLGLATVFSLVEGHGGRIELTRGARGGARFLLHFGDAAVMQQGPVIDAIESGLN